MILRQSPPIVASFNFDRLPAELAVEFAFVLLEPGIHLADRQWSFGLHLNNMLDRLVGGGGHLIGKPAQLGADLLNPLGGLPAGLAGDGDGSADAEELLRNADVAMYMAKRGNKGSYRLFEPEMHRRAGETGSLKQSIHWG